MGFFSKRRETLFGGVKCRPAERGAVGKEKHGRVERAPTRETKKERHASSVSFFFGAGNQTRTDDLLITNQLLYRLSYSSIHFHLSRSHRRQGGLDSASTIPHLPPAVKSVSQPRAFFVGQQGGKSSSRLCAPQKTSPPQRFRLQSSPAQMPPVYRIYLST